MRKLRFSSSFSAWCTDFKNVTFEKIHWPSSKVVEVKRSFSRSLRPTFVSGLAFQSYNNRLPLDFGFIEIWTWIIVWPRWPHKGLRGFFLKSYILNLLCSKFKFKWWNMSRLCRSPNLSLYEVFEKTTKPHFFLRLLLLKGGFKSEDTSPKKIFQISILSRKFE